MSGGCVFVAFQVNEKAARLTAFFIVLIIASFLYWRENWIIYAMTADFFIRAFVKPSFSPLSFISRILLSLVRVKPQLINAGPKLFAAKIGFVLCLVIIALEALLFPFWTNIAGGILIFCAGLEAFAGYCIGCKAYSFLFAKPESVDYNI